MVFTVNIEFDSISIIQDQYILFSLDQNKDGQINRKDMVKIIEAMYDLANEEDRAGQKAPEKRVELIMQRLNKDKDGRDILLINSFC